MDYNDSVARITPHNWIIQSNDGTNLVAYNPIIGETFNGTTADFNAIFLGAPTSTTVDGAIKVVEGFNLPEYDSINLGYTGANVTTITYYKGASTVAVLTLGYVDGRLTTVARTA